MAGGAVVDLVSGSRQDFTYRRLRGLRASNIDLGRSLFIGALIEDCVFEGVDFSRSDLSGTKIVRCVFEDCRFSLAEVRSCRFDETRLARCDLATSQISRTVCRNTTFQTCSFEEGTFLEGVLVGCDLADCSFRGASVTSVDFERCAFSDTGLADCTALFLFFDECRFYRFAINAETIGLTWGLTRADLDDMRIIHLGGLQAKPVGGDLVEALSSSYAARRWFVGAAAIDLSFARGPTVAVVRRLARELSGLAGSGLPCDLDELEFFARVLERLALDDRLPLFAIRSFDRATRLLLSDSEQRRKERPARLLARVDRLFLTMLDEACGLVAYDPSTAPVEVEFRMSERPDRPLDTLCLETLRAVHGADATLEFLTGRDGSWIEAWQTVPSVLATLQLVLLSVNGLLKELNKAVDNGRRLGRTVKGAKGRGDKALPKRRRNPESLGVAAADPTEARVVEVRRRALLLTDDALRRVDGTLAAVGAMSDEDLAGLRDYAGDRILAVEVRPARKAPRRPSRRTAPAS